MTDDDVTRAPAGEDGVGGLVLRLGEPSAAVTPIEFAASDRSGWEVPGLYSWWVDDAGAAELTAGLGLPVAPGLIYAGLAGATHWPSGRRSNNTLWSRIVAMHLGGNRRSSTFRLTLGAILASARGVDVVPEPEITAWMRSHLTVRAVPYPDADSLGRCERDVLRALDPPLNLQGVPQTELRARLTRLRRARPAAAVKSSTTVVADDAGEDRRTQSEYQQMLQTLHEDGLLVPFIGVPRTAIRCQQEWTWASRKVDPSALYSFDLDVLALDMSSGGPGFALSHSGHGTNSYALTLLTGAGSAAVALQHGYGGGYNDSAASRRRINSDYTDVSTALGALGRANPAPAVLIAWSGLRNEGARVDLDELRRGASVADASRRIDSWEDFIGALRECQTAPER